MIKLKKENQESENNNGMDTYEFTDAANELQKICDVELAQISDKLDSIWNRIGKNKIIKDYLSQYENEMNCIDTNLHSAITSVHSLQRCLDDLLS